MEKSNSLKPVHKHVFLTLLIVGLACVWGFIIYPQIALGINTPTNVTVRPGDGLVDIGWDPVTPGKGETIAGYRIYYSPEKGDEVSEDAGSGDVVYQIKGLQNEVLYFFEIVTFLDDGTESPRSRAITATPISGGEEEPIAIAGEPVVSVGITTATVSWSTSLSGTSIVYYGPREDFSGVTPESAEKTTEHSVELRDLIPCAAYWFKVESYDDNANSAESQGGEFKTAGCKGDSTILTYESGKITSGSGATVYVANSGRSITVNAPANLKAGKESLAVEALKLEKDLVRTAISTPTAKQWLGNAYSLKVFEDENTELNERFDEPVEVTIAYTAEDLEGIDASTLKIYHYEDSSGWQELSNCENDQDAMAVTCETSSFSIFGLFGNEASQEQGGGSGGSTTSGSISGSVPKQPTQVSVVESASTEAVTIPTPTVTPTETLNSPAVASGRFEKDLAYGDRDPLVKNLQAFLNQQNFPVALSGLGSLGNETEFFGPLTLSALIKFQEAHAKEILSPLGLVSGTGYFGINTRTFINQIQ